MNFNELNKQIQEAYFDEAEIKRHWHATNTRYDETLGLSAQEVIESVKRAFTNCHGSAYSWGNEGFGFVSVNGFLETQKLAPEYFLIEDTYTKKTIKNAAEALRVWWNSYGLYTEEADWIAEIYCNGQGPDGIGGFNEPEV